MANRIFYDIQGLQRELKILVAEVAIGATGAPTLNVAGSKGVASISRAGAGDYDVVLDDKYSEVVFFAANIFDPASEDIRGQLAVRDADATGGGTFSFFTNTGGTATDPSNGATLQLLIICRNTAA